MTTSKTFDMKKIEFEDYSLVSNYYDKYRVPAGLNQLISFINETVKDNKGAILEVGCGTGNYLSKLAEIYEKVCGVDLNEGMLAKCKEKTKNMTNVELKQGEAQNIPYPDKSFDIVVAIQTVHHYGEDNNRVAFFKEARRLLKPGGRFIMNYSEPHQSQFHYPILLGGVSNARSCKNERTPEEYTELAKQVGFKFVSNAKCSETLIREDIFWNIDNYANEEVLKSDSSFSFCTQDQKDFIMNLVRTSSPEEKKGFVGIMKKCVDYYGLSSFIAFE